MSTIGAMKAVKQTSAGLVAVAVTAAVLAGPGYAVTTPKVLRLTGGGSEVQPGGHITLGVEQLTLAMAANNAHAATTVRCAPAPGVDQFAAVDQTNNEATDKLQITAATGPLFQNEGRMSCSATGGFGPTATVLWDQSNNLLGAIVGLSAKLKAEAKSGAASYLWVSFSSPERAYCAYRFKPSMTGTAVLALGGIAATLKQAKAPVKIVYEGACPLSTSVSVSLSESRTLITSEEFPLLGQIH